MVRITHIRKLMAANQGLALLVIAVMVLTAVGGCTAAEQEGAATRPELKDEDIAWAVEREFLHDNAISAHRIDVTCEDGVISLEGSVDNLLAHERALRLTRAIRGVRAIVDKLAVYPVARTDDELRLSVVDALARDPAADSYEIKIKTDEGEVALDGTVQSWAERRIAELVTKGVAGVRAVNNQLVVDYGAQRLDSEILRDVRRRLELNPYVEEGRLDVSVVEGVVDLSGPVGSLTEKAEAYHSAHVLGVKTVNDSAVIVNWWLADESQRPTTVLVKSDESIATAVQDALSYDPRVADADIAVDVDRGVAYLTGAVPDLAAREAAGRDARNTLGVVRVVNTLKVRPARLVSDLELLEDVENALAQDPYLERYELRPVVRNGKVYLYGEVDTHYERQHAAEVVNHVGGAATVENKLEVETVDTYKTDRVLKRDVETELLWNATVDAGELEVDAAQGAVVVRGDVDTWKEFEAVIDNAFDAGAMTVDPQLTLRGTDINYPIVDYLQFFYHASP